MKVKTPSTHGFLQELHLGAVRAKHVFEQKIFLSFDCMYFPFIFLRQTEQFSAEAIAKENKNSKNNIFFMLLFFLIGYLYHVH